MYHRWLHFAGEAVVQVADAAVFDGANDFALRGADLSNNADGRKVWGSFWFNRQGGAGSVQYLYRANNFVELAFQADNTIRFDSVDSGGSASIRLISTTAFSAAGWHHCAFAADGDAGTKQLYIDGVSNINAGSSYANAVDVDWTRTNHSIGAANDGSSKYNGYLAEFIIDNDRTFDLSSATNLQKLIRNGRPVDLGATGSTPTGFQPIMFFHLDVGETANNFVTNAGDGAGFTLTGTLGSTPLNP